MSAARRATRRPTWRPEGGRLHAGAVLALRRGPVLGACGLRARLGRHSLRHRPGVGGLRRSGGLRRRCGRRPRRGGGGGPHGGPPHRDQLRPRARRRARRSSSGPTSATATSTRTGRRRDARGRRRAAEVTRAQKAAAAKTASVWWRRCPTSGASGEDRRGQVGGIALHAADGGRDGGGVAAAGLVRPGRRPHARRSACCPSWCTVGGPRSASSWRGGQGDRFRDGLA